MSARTKKLLKGIAMEKVVRLFVSKMIEQNVIEEQRRAVISYGLELFFSSVINILSILLISVLINRGRYYFTAAGFCPIAKFRGRISL